MIIRLLISVWLLASINSAFAAENRKPDAQVPKPLGRRPTGPGLSTYRANMLRVVPARWVWNPSYRHEFRI